MNRIALNPEHIEHYKQWLQALKSKSTTLSAAQWMTAKFPELKR